MTDSSSAAAPDLTISLHVAGLALRLDFAPAHAELVNELRALWGHLIVDTSGGTSASESELIVLRFVPERDRSCPDATVLRPGPFASYALSGKVTQAVIKALLGTRLLLHAGAVELPDLGTVIMVGASGAGKSTATSRLGRNGRYLTDELTILDPRTCAVTPFPKPVSLRAPEKTGKRDVALADLGLMVGEGGEAPSHVVLLERHLPGAAAEHSTVRRIPLAEATLRIVGQSSSMWKVPRGLGVLAELLHRTGGALEVAYHEAEEISDLLHAPPPPADEPFELVTSEGDPAEPGPQEYAVVPFAQALLLGDGAVVLTARTITHVTGLGAIIWEVLSASGPLRAEQIEARLEDILGAHPEQSVWLERALSDLHEQSLVRSGAAGDTT